MKWYCRSPRYQQVVVAEVKLVADADFSCRVNQHVPQAQLAVEFAQQEDFDLGARFLLVAVRDRAGKTFVSLKMNRSFSSKYSMISLKMRVFDGALGTIDHHQAGFVPVFGRVFRQQVGGEVVTVLR